MRLLYILWILCSTVAVTWAMLSASASAAPGAADRDVVCGVFETEEFEDKEFGDRMIYSLIDFSDPSVSQIHYNVQNPGLPHVQGMFNGLCYCVKGKVLPDPEYQGDAAYRLIAIESVIGGPYHGCTPWSKRQKR